MSTTTAAEHASSVMPPETYCARRRAYLGTLALLFGVLMYGTVLAGTGSNTPAEPQPAAKPAHAVQTQDKPRPRKTFTSKAYGARLETHPPGYVKPLSETGISGLEDLDWLEFGLQHRSRYEYRDDNYRKPLLTNDDEFQMRSLGYIGIKRILDPLRFGFEFADSRQFGSRFPEDTTDVDENEIIQLFGELYFEDALGANQPISLQFGRLSFDLVDRKIIGRNRWRNTINSFDGFRLRLGQASSDWEVNVIAVQPVERFTVKFDHGNDEQWFYGVTGAWRKWDKYVVLEPYYFVLDEDRKGWDTSDREIHTLGLHAFGPISDTGFDYDIDTAFQFGDDGERDHRAFAAYGELGYTLKHDWRPRLSFSTSYGSGDRNPDDNASERFDRLFAPNHYRSTSDYWTWQNVINPKLRIDFRPTDKLRIDAAYGGYWLASDSDAWVRPGLRDRTGRSGDCVGQEFEIRARYQLDPRIEIEVGYSHFTPGPFVRNTAAAADDSDMFYVATTLNLWK